MILFTLIYCLCTYFVFSRWAIEKNFDGEHQFDREGDRLHVRPSSNAPYKVEVERKDFVSGILESIERLGSKSRERKREGKREREGKGREAVQDVPSGRKPPPPPFEPESPLPAHLVPHFSFSSNYFILLIYL